MKTRNLRLRTTIIILMMLVAVGSRMLPHLPNLAPLGALSLFGAAYFTKRWQAFLVPIIATWIGDVMINNTVYAAYFKEFSWFYEGFYWQYASYAIITVIGVRLFKQISALRIVVGALLATTIFYLVSNFGVWMSSNIYPPTFDGLLTCYIAGLPFIKGTLLGHILYSAILFGIFQLLQTHYTQLQLTHKATCNTTI